MGSTYIPLAEACARLDGAITPNDMATCCQAGEISAIRTNGHWMINRLWVDQLANSLHQAKSHMATMQAERDAASQIKHLEAKIEAIQCIVTKNLIKTAEAQLAIDDLDDAIAALTQLVKRSAPPHGPAMPSLLTAAGIPADRQKQTISLLRDIATETSDEASWLK